MKFELDKYQTALLLDCWTLSMTRGIIKLHIYWKKEIDGVEYKYYEKECSAQYICAEHDVEVDNEN